MFLDPDFPPKQTNQCLNRQTAAAHLPEETMSTNSQDNYQDWRRDILHFAAFITIIFNKLRRPPFMDKAALKHRQKQRRSAVSLGWKPFSVQDYKTAWESGQKGKVRCQLRLETLPCETTKLPENQARKGRSDVSWGWEPFSNGTHPPPTSWDNAPMRTYHWRTISNEHDKSAQWSPKLVNIYLALRTSSVAPVCARRPNKSNSKLEDNFNWNNIRMNLKIPITQSQSSQSPPSPQE